MRIKQKIFIFACVFLMANAVQVAAVEEKVVPVHEEPRHRLVFDKDGVLILNVSIPPGDTSLYHTHSDPTMYVVFNRATVRIQTLGEDWVQLDPEQTPNTGDIVYREDYLEKPLTHRAENLDDTPFQVFGVINRGKGNESIPDTKIDAEPEVASRWFRAYRFNLVASDETEVHKHEHPVIVVQVHNGNSVVIENDWPTALKTVGGTWSWHRGKTEHTLKNIGESGIELIEIEVIN